MTDVQLFDIPYLANIVERRRGMGTTKLVMPVWPTNLVGQVEQPVRVLLVEDDTHVRRVLAQQLLGDRRIQLVAEGANLREGKRLVAQHEFEVLLVDLNLGEGSGLELVTQAKALRPGVEAIVVSSVEDEHMVLQAFAAGANGYLLKNSWFDSVALAVLQVVNGGAPLSPNLARRLLRRLSQPERAAAPPERAASVAESLSEREKDVLRLVANGCTSAAVGQRLTISALTVDTHIKNIYRKLQVRSRAQAVTCAAAHGWI